MSIELLIICYIPEIKNYVKDIANKVEQGFLKGAKSVNPPPKLNITKITQKNHNLVIKNLKNLAKKLKSENKKAIIYYHGHGNQIRDTSGDEIDGKDEIWETQCITDDTLSKIFADIHDTSTLYVFSDSCSSGSMIDSYYNKKDWVTISSCKDYQDSLASSDGGIFTFWGLIPALETLEFVSPRNIHKYIENNIEIASQKSVINYTNISTLDKSIF